MMIIVIVMMEVMNQGPQHVPMEGIFYSALIYNDNTQNAELIVQSNEIYAVCIFL